MKFLSAVRRESDGVARIKQQLYLGSKILK
jgi:hypothetical protein